MIRKSIRTRLTITNLIVLAVALFSFGFLAVTLNRENMLRDIDRDLRERGNVAGRAQPRQGPGFFGQGRGPDQGFGPGPGFGQGLGQGRGTLGQPQPGQGGDPGAPPEGGVPGLFGPGPGRRGPPPQPIDDPRTAYGMALFVDKSGKVVRPREIAQAYDANAIAKAPEQPLLTTAKIDDRSVRVLTQPWIVENEVRGQVQVARSLKEVEDNQQLLLQVLFVLLPVSVLLAGALSYWVTHRAVAPLIEITRAVGAVRSEDLGSRLTVSSEDEIGTLGTRFNSMLDRLQATFAERDAAYQSLQEAFENQRRFTADASHELRTPLTRLKLATSGALSSDGDLKEALRVADQAADSMNRLVQELLLLSRGDAGQLAVPDTWLDLRVVAVEALDALPFASRIQVELGEQEIGVRGDDHHLRRVVTNLLENASRHTPESGTITLKVTQQGERAVLTVRDTGSGISSEHLPHLFDRFYQADRSRTGSGTGLGLAICKTLVDAHHGTIQVQSQLGVGTLVSVDLPFSVRERSSRIPHESESK